MNVYQKVSVLMALTLYLPLAYQIVSGKVEQNFVTFLLWGTLDGVAGLSMMVQGGNFQLPLAYVIGCIVILVAILYSGKRPTWTRFESQMTLVVILSLLAWSVSGPWAATIFSTAGVVFGGLPQLQDSWNRPEKSPLGTYLLFTVVNVLSTIGGSAWTVEERLYPFSCVLLCGTITLASLRKVVPVLPVLD